MHPRLRPFVAAAVGYRQEGMAPGEHLGLPSPFLTFVVPFDEPLDMAAHPDPDEGHLGQSVCGLGTRDDVRAGIQTKRPLNRTQ